MNLAILMTNTDESEFAHRHPKDGEKFTDLIHLVRPNWQLTTFAVKDEIFPDDVSYFDGFIITGSPASVHDNDPWVGRLLELIRLISSKDIPMFGACYGHQAIALALGGEVAPNPSGWVFGLTRTEVVDPAEWMIDLPKEFAQYSAHLEAVTKLPTGASVLTTSEDCAISGYRIENKVYTTQNHPEMTSVFIAALVREYRDKLPEEVGKAAQTSLTEIVDSRPYANTIAEFFEFTSVN